MSSWDSSNWWIWRVYSIQMYRCDNTWNHQHQKTPANWENFRKDTRGPWSSEKGRSIGTSIPCVLVPTQFVWPIFKCVVIWIQFVQRSVMARMIKHPLEIHQQNFQTIQRQYGNLYEPLCTNNSLIANVPWTIHPILSFRPNFIKSLNPNFSVSILTPHLLDVDCDRVDQSIEHFVFRPYR